MSASGPPARMMSSAEVKLSVAMPDSAVAVPESTGSVSAASSAAGAGAPPGPSLFSGPYVPQDRSLPNRAITSSTIDAAFILYILYCNPTFPLDTDVTQLRLAFCSPPQSEGQTFDMWRLYQLYGELVLRRIKTWTDLVRAWGVKMPSEGQSSQKVQQYSSRLKRWMHGLHIDSFFDYLYGREHDYFINIPHPADPFASELRDGVSQEEDQALRALNQNSRSRRGRQKIEIGGGPLILQYQSHGTSPVTTVSDCNDTVPSGPTTATPTPSSSSSSTNFSTWKVVSFGSATGPRKRPRVDTSTISSGVDMTPHPASTSTIGTTVTSSPLVWVQSGASRRPMSAVEPGTSSYALGGTTRPRPIATPVSAFEPVSTAFSRATVHGTTATSSGEPGGNHVSSITTVAEEPSPGRFLTFALRREDPVGTAAVAAVPRPTGLATLAPHVRVPLPPRLPFGLPATPISKPFVAAPIPLSSLSTSQTSDSMMSNSSLNSSTATSSSAGTVTASTGVPSSVSFPVIQPGLSTSTPAGRTVSGAGPTSTAIQPVGAGSHLSSNPAPPSYPPSFSALESALAADLGRSELVLSPRTARPGLEGSLPASSTAATIGPTSTLSPIEARALAGALLARLRGTEFPATVDGESGWRIAAAAWLDLATWFGEPVPVWHPSGRRKRVWRETAAVSSEDRMTDTSPDVGSDSRSRSETHPKSHSPTPPPSPPLSGQQEQGREGEAVAAAAAAIDVLSQPSGSTMISDSDLNISQPTVPATTDSTTTMSDIGEKQNQSQDDQVPVTYTVEWTSVLGGVSATMTVQDLVIADAAGRPVAPPQYGIPPEVTRLDVWRGKMLKSLFDEQ